MTGRQEAAPGPQGSPQPRPAASDLRTWTAAIAALASAVNGQLPLGPLLDLVAQTACRLLGYDSCGVLLADPERTALRIRGSSGLAAEYVQRVNEHAPLLLTGTGPLTDSPSRRAFTAERPVVIPDITADAGFGPWGPAALEQGFRAMAALPLPSQGQVIGTVNVYSRAPRDLDPAGLELLQVLAHHAGIALETSAMLERERVRVAELTSQAAMLEQAAAIHDRLTGEALRGGGPGSIAAALAELIGRPVLVEDAAGRLLASAAHAGVTVRPPPVAQRPALPGVPGSSAGRLTAVGELLVGQVRLGEEDVGRVWLPASPPLDELGLRAVGHAAIVLALDALRRRSASEALWQLRGELVTELLSGGRVDAEAAVVRADRLGSDLRLPHAVLVLRCPAGPADAARALHAAAGDLAKPRPLVAARDRDVVVLVPEVPGRPLTELVRRLAGAAASTGGPGTRAASSDPDGELSALPGALRRARALLDLVPHREGEGVLTTSSTGLAGLLLSEVDTARVAGFADRRLGPLREHDTLRGTDLVGTLRSYLRHDRSTAATAADLYVHPNTVALRVRRIEALLDVDLGRVEDLTDLRAALLIDEVRRPSTA